MNRQDHLMMWDQMRLRHGITLRLVEQIPADKLREHPIPGMRTPIELVVHTYAGVKVFPESVLSGSVPDYDDKAEAAAIADKAALLAYVNAAWAAGDRAARSVTDVQLGAMVTTPWGHAFPGFAMFGIVQDEFLHHRGQLYAYLRVFGITPVMNWDYDHSAPEFQPAKHAQA